MIPDFKTYLNEGLFTNTIRRGYTDEKRKEDDINILKQDDFYEYLSKRYKLIGINIPFVTESQKYISIPLFYKDSKIFRMRIFYKNEIVEKICIYATEDDCEEFIDILKSKFSITRRDVPKLSTYTLMVAPKDGEISNETCIDLIDTVLKNTKEPVYEIQLEEGLFTNTIRRGYTDEVRKEDDVDLLDKNEFLLYLNKHYTPTSMDYIRYSKIDDALSIPIGFDNMRLVFQHEKLRLRNYFFEKYGNIFINTDIDVDRNGLFPYLKPKDGGDITNRFIMRVLDFILDNIKDPALKKKS